MDGDRPRDSKECRYIYTDEMTLDEDTLHRLHTIRPAEEKAMPTSLQRASRPTFTTIPCDSDFAMIFDFLGNGQMRTTIPHIRRRPAARHEGGSAGAITRRCRRCEGFPARQAT